MLWLLLAIFSPDFQMQIQMFEVEVALSVHICQSLGKMANCESPPCGVISSESYYKSECGNLVCTDTAERGYIHSERGFEESASLASISSKNRTFYIVTNPTLLLEPSKHHWACARIVNNKDTDTAPLASWVVGPICPLHIPP